MSFGELVVVKEYPAELAGERVGWASVREYEREDIEPIYVADVVTATVGESGAKLTHYVQEVDGEIKSSAGAHNNEGLTAVSGLSVVLRRGQDRLESSCVSYASSDQKYIFGDINTLLQGAQGFQHYKPEVEVVNWVHGASEVRNELVEGLKAHEMEDFYPLVYYLYNLHTAYPDKFLHTEHLQAAKARLLPDPEMMDYTRLQTDITRSIVFKLAEIRATDLGINRIIDQHGSGQLPELVDQFIAGRRSVAGAESKLVVLRDGLVVPYFGYLPVGFRPQGRTWPYMNPMGKGDKEAFGLEVSALQSENRRTPSRELEREIEELGFRIEHARKNIVALGLLESAEIEVVLARRLAEQ